MTHQSAARYIFTGAEAGRQLAQLRHVLELVEQIAGRARSPRDAALDEAAWLSAAYDDAMPVVQRRFDILAAETAAWAAAGVEALLLMGEQGASSQAAAGALADELHCALAELARILGN